MKNNYDTSTQGVWLELQVFYDTDLSSIFFQDDIERIGWYRDNTFFYKQGWEYSMDKMYTVTDYNLFREHYISDDILTDDEIDDIIINEELDDTIPGVSQKYPSIEVRWYSQWDYAKVYYNHECLNEHFTVKELKESVHHLFYDAPVYCRLTIDWEEFCFEEYMKDTYEYDKDEIIQIAKDNIKHDKKDYIVQWLCDNLPEHPEYL